MKNRYVRQETFYGIGAEGQKKLLKSRVAIIGIGALGTVNADHLARAGVGYIKLVDFDVADITNLQRQMLYTEEDVKDAVPKARAAAEHLSEVNSEIVIASVEKRFSNETAEELIGDVDLVIDSTDNIKTRFLINRACRKLKKNWIYGGAIGSTGMTCNFLYGNEYPCMNCILDEKNGDTDSPTAKEAGILNSTTAIVASIQSSEALKILTGSKTVRKTMIYFDLWKNKFEEMKVEKNPDCPVCSS